MPSFADFLPPILTRPFQRNSAASKELGVGQVDFLPGMAEFLNPSEPVYRSARDYSKMAQHGYTGNVYLYRAVTVITQAIAGIPWHLYKRSRGGDRSAQDGHPLLALLNIQANDEESGPEFLEALNAYWLLAGVTYIWAVRPETGASRAPTKLFALQPDLLRPDVARDGTLQGWIYQIGDHKQEFAVDDILRIKDFHPLTRAAGVAPAQVAVRPLDQHNAANDWNTALLQNMARPSGLLSPKNDAIIPPDAHDTLKTELRERYQGPKNAGRPLVPRAAMQWQAMGQTPSEMDWLAGKTQAAREIAIAFGVPPELLGDAANKTYSNQVEARRALYMETILPRMDRLKASLSRWLLPMYGLDPALYTIDYDRNDIEALAADQDEIHTRARSDYAGGLISLNEAREMLGEDAIDEGDIFLAPPRAMTLDQLLEGAGLPSMPDGSIAAHPPAVPPAGVPHPELPTTPTPPALPAGQIVDANPPTAATTGGAKSVRPFVVSSPSLRAKRLARQAAAVQAATQANTP